MVNVYEQNEYRAVLKSALLAKKARFGRKFTFEKLAKACRLQRTYVSAVLAGRGQLNADQVFMACAFLEMKEDEYRFTSLLHEMERSVFSERKTQLKREIDRMRSEALKTESYIPSTVVQSLETPALVEFYLDFQAQIIHMFLSVKRFRLDPEKVRRTLNIEPEVFQKAVNKIERAGLIKIKGQNIDIISDSFHLPASSPLFPYYRIQMRLKALDLMEKYSRDDHYSFSVLYSANEASRRKMVARFLEYVEWSQKETQKEQPLHVYQMNFDLLRWSRE